MPALDHSQHNTLTPSNTTFNITVTSTTGNLLILSIATNASAAKVTAVSGNVNGAFTQVGAGGTTPIPAQIFYFQNAATGTTTVTVTIGGSGAQCGYAWYDVSGMKTSSALETSLVLDNQTATANPQGPSVTTSGSSDFIVSLCSPANAITAVASPFNPGDFFDSTITGTGFAHVLNGAANTYNPSWTQSSSGTWSGVTAAFSAASSAVAGWKSPVAGPSYAI